MELPFEQPHPLDPQHIERVWGEWNALLNRAQERSRRNIASGDGLGDDGAIHDAREMWEFVTRNAHAMECRGFDSATALEVLSTSVGELERSRDAELNAWEKCLHAAANTADARTSVARSTAKLKADLESISEEKWAAMDDDSRDAGLAMLDDLREQLAAMLDEIPIECRRELERRG